jgi:hypothetical protein
MMPNRRRALTLHTLLVSSLAVAAPPPLPGGHAGFAGETLEYRIRLGPIRAGSATVVTRTAAIGREGAVEIELSARSDGLLASLLPVRDRITSVAAVGDLRSLRLERRIREGRRKIHDVWTVDHDLAVATDGQGGQVAVPPGIHDILSVLWRLRAVALAPGDTVTLPVLVAGRATRLNVTVGPEREVEVPAGRFRCLPLCPGLERIVPFDPHGPLVIDLAVGATGPPVRISLDLPVAGRARFELVRHDPPDGAMAP